MRKVICNVCGEEMIWDGDNKEWACPCCFNSAFQKGNEIYYEHGGDDDYEEYYDPEDMSPDKDGFDPEDFR